MTTPRRGLRRGVLLEDDEDDEDDEEADGDATEEPESSLEDLVSPADPSSFDRTFLAGDASLAIEGGFDPVAGRKQVIPRVAYVLNFNLVYNRERDRWEPDEGGQGNDIRGEVGQLTLSHPGTPPDATWDTEKGVDGTVTFDTDFNDPPAVTARVLSPLTDDGLPVVKNISNDSMSVGYNQLSTQTDGETEVTVEWIAIEEAA